MSGMTTRAALCCVISSELVWFWQQPPSPPPSVSPGCYLQFVRLLWISLVFNLVTVSAPWKTASQSLVITIKLQLVWTQYNKTVNGWNCLLRWKTLRAYRNFIFPIFYKILFLLIYFFSFTFNSCPLWVWQYCCLRLLLLCVTQRAVENEKVNNSSTKTQRWHYTHTKIFQLQSEDTFRCQKTKTSKGGITVSHRESI